MKTSKFWMIIVVASLLWSCKHEFPEIATEEITPSVDQANLSNVVFMGGSAFAGVADGGLSSVGIENSVPALFLENINETALEAQPNFLSENGFNIFENQDLTDNQGVYRLFYPVLDTAGFSRETKPGSAFQYSNSESNEITSYSFPRAQLLDFTERDRTQNPYIGQFYVDRSRSVLDRVAAQSPSFFVVDLMEELLGFTLNGAEGAENSTDALTSGYDDLIDETLFRQKLEELTGRLLGQGTDVKGAVLTIPDFLKFPYFRRTRFDISPYILGIDYFLGATVSIDSPWRTARPASQQFNEDLVEFYRLNPNTPSNERRPFLDFGLDIVGDWGIIVEDDDLADLMVNGRVVPKIRHVKRDEILFFFHEFLLGDLYGFLPTTAIPEDQYLKQTEINFIHSKIDALNQIIDQVVQNSNGRLVKVDIHAFYERMFEDFAPLFARKGRGILVDGVLLEPHISEVGIFSGDGLYLNPAGNALVTNEIIKAINNAFAGDIKLLNPNNFPGTTFEGER